MAGSRREKIGSIFSRMSGLMKSGAFKYEDRPIWYDIVKAFPPKPVPPPKQIQKIFYPEDYVRVHFYEKFAQTDPILLSNNKFKSVAQKFVDKYLELHRSNTVDGKDLFDHTIVALNSEGYRLFTHEEKAATFVAKATEKLPTTNEKVEPVTKPVDLKRLFNDDPV